MRWRASSVMCASAPIRLTCSRPRPVAWQSSGRRSRISVCTKSRWNEASKRRRDVRKQPAREGGLGGGDFFCYSNAKVLSSCYHGLFRRKGLRAWRLFSVWSDHVDQLCLSHISARLFTRHLYTQIEMVSTKNLPS